MKGINSTHYVDYYRIEITQDSEGLQIEIPFGHVTYRAKCPSGGMDVVSARHHYSMAVAEPIVSDKMLNAMKIAVSERLLVKA